MYIDKVVSSTKSFGEVFKTYSKKLFKPSFQFGHQFKVFLDFYSIEIRDYTPMGQPATVCVNLA